MQIFDALQGWFCTYIFLYIDNVFSLWDLMFRRPSLLKRFDFSKSKVIFKRPDWSQNLIVICLFYDILW